MRGYSAGTISITPLGDRIVRPKREGEDLAAKREAFLRPRIINKFLNQYDGSPLPREQIALNVLEDLGVPKERISQVFSIISTVATSLGLCSPIKGKVSLDLSGVSTPPPVEAPVDDEQGAEDQPGNTVTVPTNVLITRSLESPGRISQSGTQIRRVFVTHGKNREFVEPIKQLLQFGELESVVSVEMNSRSNRHRTAISHAQ